jgi:hypothetical protein
MSVERVWADIRSGGVDRQGIASPDGSIGMDLTVTRPGTASWSLASIIKPLLDGLVSAFHSHDGTHLNHVAEVLAASLREPVDAIRSALADPGWGILGVRRLLWPRAGRVQWNPADERLVDVRIRLERGNRPAFSGRLIEI